MKKVLTVIITFLLSSTLLCMHHQQGRIGDRIRTGNPALEVQDKERIAWATVSDILERDGGLPDNFKVVDLVIATICWRAADDNMKKDDAPAKSLALCERLVTGHGLKPTGLSNVFAGIVGHRRTPLHYACELLDPDVVNVLLQTGADKDQRDGDGRTVYNTFTTVHGYTPYKERAKTIMGLLDANKKR